MQSLLSYQCCSDRFEEAYFNWEGNACLSICQLMLQFAPIPGELFWKDETNDIFVLYNLRP